MTVSCENRKTEFGLQMASSFFYDYNFRNLTFVIIHMNLGLMKQKLLFTFTLVLLLLSFFYIPWVETDTMVVKTAAHGTTGSVLTYNFSGKYYPFYEKPVPIITEIDNNTLSHEEFVSSNKYTNFEVDIRTLFCEWLAIILLTTSIYLILIPLKKIKNGTNSSQSL